MKNKGPEEVMIYQAKSGAIEFRGDLEQDTMWGNLNQVAALFNVQKPAISKHLKNIYKEPWGELSVMCFSLLLVRTHIRA